MNTFDPNSVSSGGVLTVNHRAYTVLSLLGRGKGGYSYLVTDGEHRCVLKQIHHEPCDYYAFGDKLAAERNDYARLTSIGVPIPKLLDVDADAERILKEYIDGPTAAELVQTGRMQPQYIEQIEALCERLYAHHTNIDYYPTNFVLENGTLYYVDYECNDYMPEWDFAHWGKQYWISKGGTPMNRLFIYYSLSGNGDLIAETLEKQGFALRRVTPKKKPPKRFFWQVLAGGFGAGVGRKEPLSGYDPDVKDFDEIVIGSPVWNARLSCPINTVLAETDLSGKKLTFVLYAGSGEAPKATKKINERYPDARILLLKEPKKHPDELKKLAQL